MEIRDKSGELIIETNADSLVGANLSCTILREVDLKRADLRGANLSNSVLTYADLSWADLRGADLCRTILNGSNLYYADLREANLCGANMKWTHLRHANLIGAKVYEDFTIISQYGIMTIGYLGCRYDYTIFFNCQEIIVRCGCFCGTIDEFEKRVKETHGDNKYGKDYRDTIEYVKKVFGRR